MASKSMLVEFLGIPGSGKSTLSHITAKILKEKGIEASESTFNIDRINLVIMRKLTKFWLAIITTLKNPTRRIGCIWTIYKTRQETLNDFITVTINWLYVTELARKKRYKRSVHIMDQGLFQALWSIFYRAEDKSIFIKHFLNNIQFYLPENIIVILTKPKIEIIKDRIRKRNNNNSRLENKGTNSRLSMKVEKANICLAEVENVIGSVNNYINVETFEVNNDKDDIEMSYSREIAVYITKKQF